VILCQGWFLTRELVCGDWRWKAGVGQTGLTGVWGCGDSGNENSTITFST